MGGNQAVPVDVLIGDTIDPVGTNVAAAIVSDGSASSAIVSDSGAVTYTSSNNADATDTFTYSVSDGSNSTTNNEVRPRLLQP